MLESCCAASVLGAPAWTSQLISLLGKHPESRKQSQRSKAASAALAFALAFAFAFAFAFGSGAAFPLRQA